MNASVNSTDAIRRVAHGQLSYRALTTPQWSVPGWWDRTAAAHIRGPATRSCRGTSPWLKWGYRRPAAASPAHYAKLPRASYRTDVSSRLCIGWPRGDPRGSFHSYSHAKRGASPLRLPACRAGQQCVSPPSCRPGPQSSRSGSVFPRAEQSGQGPPLVLSCCCFLSWRLLRHQFENRDVRLVCHQLLAVGDHAPRTPGRACRGGSRAWLDKILLSCHWLTIRHHLQAREDGKPII